jgi:hypothetical protein
VTTRTGAQHPQEANCFSCHPFTPQTHQNVRVDVSCTGCHGYPPATMRNGGQHPQDSNCATCHPSPGVAPAHNNGTVDITAGSCGACHGNPPAPPHPTATITQCASCHPTTVDNTGAIRPNGTHMNGREDFTCTNCHGNPPSSHRDAHRDEGGSMSDCARCHGSNLTNGDHLNGDLDFAPGVSCGQCHGGDGDGGWGGGGDGGGWGR